MIPLKQGYRSIQVEADAGIATVSLDRPERLNVLNSEALRELDDALEVLARDATCRSIVVRSHGGRAFSAGADIREMRDLDPAGARSFSELGQRITGRIERDLPPVVLAANGYVMGGGLEIACACDFRIASEDAVFAQPEINICIFPGWGGSQRLARVIGLPRARELVLTGRTLSAEEALAIGLVHAVVPMEDLHARAHALASDLALKSRAALMAAKRAMNQVSELPLRAGLEYERDSWALLFGSGDQREGMTAFLEHRKPRYRTSVEPGRPDDG